MKRLVVAALMFAVVSASAQTPDGRGTELPRRQLRPYATVEEAEAETGGESRYIVPVTEWTRSEQGGRTLFSAEFVYPLSWLNRQVLVRIGSASAGYAVEVGGRRAGTASNGAAPVEFNVTNLAVQGVNTLTVVLDEPQSNEPLTRADVAWLGSVEIVSQPTLRVRDVDVRTTLNDSGDGIFEAAVVVKTDALNPKQGRISYELAYEGERLTAGYKDVKLEMRGEDTVRFVAIVPKVLLWSTESPTLLTLTLRNRIEGRYAENIVVPVGARAVEYRDNTLFVNGKATSLKTAVVSSNVSVGELQQMKDSGFNAVTVAAGEAAAGLYDACDSAGVYVVTQVAVDTSNGGRSIKKGGNASNDPTLTDEYPSRTFAAFHTAKNHPSVVAFSLGGGIVNGINTYESYLLMKGLDGSRPVVYDGAGGEWNNDRFDHRTVKQQ